MCHIMLCTLYITIHAKVANPLGNPKNPKNPKIWAEAGIPTQKLESLPSLQLLPISLGFFGFFGFSGFPMDLLPLHVWCTTTICYYVLLYTTICYYVLLSPTTYYNILLDLAIYYYIGLYSTILYIAQKMNCSLPEASLSFQKHKLSFQKHFSILTETDCILRKQLYPSRSGFVLLEANVILQKQF